MINDIIFEIAMQWAALVTGCKKSVQAITKNFLLSVAGMYPDRTTIFDLCGKCSGIPAIYDTDDMLAVLDGFTCKYSNIQQWVFINDFEMILATMSGKNKQLFLHRVSDLVNRGQCYGVHIIIATQKYNIPVLSGIDCRVHAGHSDKKSIQKFFGAVSACPSSWYVPTDSELLCSIFGNMYRVAIDEICKDNIDICADVQIDMETDFSSSLIPDVSERPETEEETEAEAEAEEEPETDNIIVRLLLYLIDLLTGACAFLQDIKKYVSVPCCIGFRFVQCAFTVCISVLSVFVHVVRCAGVPAAVSAVYLLMWACIASPL